MRSTMATDLSILLPRPSLRRRESNATAGPAKVRETAAAVQKGSAVKKPPPRQLQRLPPIGGGGGGAKADDRKNNGVTATAGAERAAKAWMRRALAKRVATRMLKRSTAPPQAADEGSGAGGRKVLACCCARLPPGMRCALHQAGAPGRGWMLRAQQRRGCCTGSGGGDCEAVAPPRAHGGAFSEYARWRRHVWMPSRFYLEHVEELRSSIDS